MKTIEEAREAAEAARAAYAAALDVLDTAIAAECESKGHVPGTVTYYIDRGMTYEGLDYHGCKVCGKNL